MALARMLGLWLLLVTLFVAFYKFFSREGGGEDAAAGALPMVLSVGVLVFVVAFFIFLFRARKANSLCNDGNLLMSKGRYVAALEKFEQSHTYLKNNVAIHYNRGVAHFSLWRLTSAAEHLSKARRSTLGGNLQPLVIPHQALVAALLGDRAAAERFLSEARSSKNDDSALALLAQAVLHCRARAFSSAAAVLDRPELGILGGVHRGLADALRSWCFQELSGGPARIDAVAVYGEVGPDVVREIWPELAGLIEANVQPSRVG